MIKNINGVVTVSHFIKFLLVNLNKKVRMFKSRWNASGEMDHNVSGLNS